jgi:hypothetical protein
VTPRQASHQIDARLAAQGGTELRQPRAIVAVDSVVGIQPEDPVLGGVAERFVAGRGKVVAPGEFVDLRAQARSHFPRAVGRAGVDDDHLVDQAGDLRQAVRKVVFLIPDDHAQ